MSQTELPFSAAPIIIITIIIIAWNNSMAKHLIFIVKIYITVLG